MADTLISTKFRNLIDTLNLIDKDILNLTNLEIEYYLLEVVITKTPFISKSTLEELLDYNLITKEIINECELLRRKILNIDSTNLWNLSAIKNSTEWKEIFDLSKEIQELINQMWTPEEIEYLKSMT